MPLEILLVMTEVRCSLLLIFDSFNLDGLSRSTLMIIKDIINYGYLNEINELYFDFVQSVVMGERT